MNWRRDGGSPFAGKAEFVTGRLNVQSPQKSGIYALHASRTGRMNFVNWLRHCILELWAMMLASAVVGFFGPFGSYLSGNFVTRFSQWSLMLLGSYVMVRPVIFACHWLAQIGRAHV